MPNYIYQPKYSIWIILLATTIINALMRFGAKIENDWIIFWIYIAGFILIAILTYIYYLDQKTKGQIEFCKDVVKRDIEELPDGTIKRHGAVLTPETAQVIKQALK